MLVCNQSATLDEAAERIGVGRMTLYRWLKERGIDYSSRPRKCSMCEDRVRRIRQVYQNEPNVSVTNIQERFNVGKTTIYRYITPSRRVI